MKKIMTALLCALGFSLASQAEKISGTNFEGLDVDFEVIGKTDDGSLNGGYWSNTVESVEALVATNTFTMVEVPPQEEGGDPTYDKVFDIVPYSGTVGYPSVHGNADSENYLSINTKGGELVRNIQEGGSPQSIGGGIYFDSMVQFTATDALDANAGSESDKLILWLRDNGNGTTNLVVTAGYLNDEYTVARKDYVVQNSVQADKWYRLTIQAIAGAVNAPGKAYVGYAIYIDGEKACYATSEAAFDGESGYEVSSPYNNYLYKGEVHALYPSLKSWDATGVNTFTAVAFSGVGAVDDIMFTTNAYDVAFTAPPASLTVDWTVGIATVTITRGEEAPIVIATEGVAGSTNITEKGSYTVAATVQTGYVAATVSQAQVTIENTEETVHISTEEGYAEINGTLYATLPEAVAAAQSGATVKLYKGKDLGNATLAINNQNAFVLDLNGKVLSGSNSGGVLSVGNNLTIIDSIGGGAVSNTTAEAEAEAVAVIVDGGSLVVGLAENDMGASFYGMVGPNGEEPFSIVRGNFYSDDAETIGGFVAQGSVGDMIEGCYVVAPDTNVYVAQIGGNKYTTLADAVAAAGSSDTVTLLANIELDQMQHIANGKVVTLDLAGHSVQPSATWVRKTSGDALFCVDFGGSLTIADSATGGTISNNGSSDVYAAVKMTNIGDNSLNGTASLVVNGGTLEGYWYAVTGNGMRHGTEITVNGGTLRATATGNDANETLAIYHPQSGTLTLNGGTLVGGTGVEIRSGNLVIPATSTVSITATAPFKSVANGSGSTVEGAAIAVSQHTTNREINIGIGGGTFNATGNDGKALFVVDTVNSDPTGVALSVSNGTFNASVVVDNSASDVTGFVAGGTFNTPVETEYCATGFIPADNGDGTYGVEAGWKITFVNDDDTLIYATNVQANATVEYLGETPTKAADESYTYTFNGWTPTLAAATADATYKATYQATSKGPTVDGDTVAPEEVFEEAASNKPIVYPTAPTITTDSETGSQTIIYGGKTVDVPAYYTATASGNTVTLELNNNAVPAIEEATISDVTKPAMEVTGSTTAVTLGTTNTKLYYGLVSADAPDSDDLNPASAGFTEPALTQGNGGPMQISIPIDSNETSKFYKVYVTDIAPASGN